MPVRYDPEVNVLLEMWMKFRRSRKLQSYILFGGIALLLLLYASLLKGCSEDAKNTAYQSLPEPKSIPVEAISELQFMDGKTGSPLVWYYSAGGQYHLYDARGYGPEGQPLIPISTQQKIDEIRVWSQQFLAHESRSQARKLFDFDSISGSEGFEVIINPDFAAKHQSFLETFSGADGALSMNRANSDLFSQQHFKSLYEGGRSLLEQARYFQQGSSLALIQPTLEYSDTSSIEGMRSCKIRLKVAIHRESSASPRYLSLSSSGAGFSDSASLQSAIENFWISHRTTLENTIYE